MPPMTGRVIAGRYNLAEPIGRGAMGVVWRARDLLLDRDVAVKEVVLNAAIGEDERQNAYQRTFREARTAARLSHRGVVTVYDVAEEDGRPWIVMELVPSRSLDQILSENGPVTARRAGRIGQQLLSALAAAHAAGVLHRDVKPSNVLIAPETMGTERAVLTDFGIAQFEGDPRLTQTGMVMGSPGFTAPERIRGGSATPASDLWSLGATIYAAVEGRGPYEQRGGAITTMTAIINEDAPAAPSAGRLAPVIAALLRREPSARPPAMAAARMFAEILPYLPDQRPGRGSGRARTTPNVLPRSLPVTPPAVPTPFRVPSPSPAPVASSPPAPVSASASAPASSSTSATAKERASQRAAAKEEAAELEASGHEAPGHEASGHEGEKIEAGARSDASAVKTPGAGTPGAETPGAETPGSEDAAAKVADSAVDADAAAASADADDTEESAASESGAKDPGRKDPGRKASGGKESGGNGLAAEETVAKDQVAAEPPAAEDETKDRLRREPDVAAESGSLLGDETIPNAPAPVTGKAGIGKAGISKPSIGTDAIDIGTISKAPIGKAPIGKAPIGQASVSKAPVSSAASEAPTEVQAKGTAQPAGPSFSPAAPTPVGPAVPSTRPQVPYSAPTDNVIPFRPRKRRKRIGALALTIVVVAAAAIVTVILLNRHTPGTQQAGTGTNTAQNTDSDKNAPAPVQALDSPASALPAGWTGEEIPPTQKATTAGFSIGVPPEWVPQQAKLATDLLAPDGIRYMDIDLTPHKYTNMLAEAEYIAKNAMSQGHLPGYQQVALQPVNIRGSAGAYWAFTWVTNSGVTMRVDDLLFILNGQSYALYFTTPADEFNSALGLPLYEQILRTFEPVQG